MKPMTLVDKVNEKGQLSAANFARIEKKAKSNRVNDAYELESKGKKVKLVFTTDAETMQRIAFLYTEGAKYATLVQLSTEGDAVTADIFQRLKITEIDKKIQTKLQEITKSTEKFVDALAGELAKKNEEKNAKKQALIGQEEKKLKPESKTSTSTTAKADKNMKGEKNMKKETSKGTSKFKQVEEKGKTTYFREDNLNNYLKEFESNLEDSVNKLVDNRQDKTKPYAEEKVASLAKKVFDLNAKNFDHYEELVGDSIEMERKLIEFTEKRIKEHYKVEKKPVVKDVKFIESEIIRRLNENRNVPMTDVSDEMYKLRVKNAVNDYRISKHVGQKDGKDVLFTLEDISKIDGVYTKIDAAEEFSKGLVAWVSKKHKVNFEDKDLKQIIDFAREEVLTRALTDRDVSILVESASTQKEFKSPIYKFSKELKGYIDEAGVRHEGLIDKLAKKDNYEERAAEAVKLTKKFIRDHKTELDKSQQNEKNWRAYLMIQAQGINPLDPTVGKIETNRALTEAEADQLIGFARNIAANEKIEGLSAIENKVVKEKLAALKQYMEENPLVDLNKNAEGTGYYFTRDNNGQFIVNLTDEKQKEVADRYKLTEEQQKIWDEAVNKVKENNQFKLTPEQQAKWDKAVKKVKEGKNQSNLTSNESTELENAAANIDSLVAEQPEITENKDSNEEFTKTNSLQKILDEVDEESKQMDESAEEKTYEVNEEFASEMEEEKAEFDAVKPDAKPQILRIKAGKKNGEYRYLVVAQHPKREEDKSVYMLEGNSITKCFDKDGNFVATPSKIFELGGQVVDKIILTGKKNEKTGTRPNVSFRNYINAKDIEKMKQGSLNEGDVLEFKDGKLVKANETSVEQYLKDNLTDKKYKNVVEERSPFKRFLKSKLAWGLAGAALVAAILTHGGVTTGQEGPIRAKAREDVNSYFNEKGQTKVVSTATETAANENSLFRYKVQDGKVVGIEGVGLIDTILREQISKGVSLTGLKNGWLQLGKLKGYKVSEMGKVLGELAAEELINLNGVEIDETCVQDKNGNPISRVKIDGKYVDILPVGVSDSNKMTEENTIKYLKEIGLSESQAEKFVKGWNESFSAKVNENIAGKGNTNVEGQGNPSDPGDDKKEDFTVKGNAFRNNLATLLGMEKGADIDLVCANEENGRAYVLLDKDNLAVIDFSSAVGANSADKVSQANVEVIERISANAFENLADSKQSTYGERFNKFLQEYKNKNASKDSFVNIYWGEFDTNSENGNNNIQPSLWFVTSDSTGKVTKIEEMIGKKVEYKGDLKQEYLFASFIPGYTPRVDKETKEGVTKLTGEVTSVIVDTNSLDAESGNFLGDGTVNVNALSKEVTK